MIFETYAAKTPRSKELHEKAKTLLPNGVTHVGRYLEPHPVYIDHAAGSRKWDVDGNEYVDYFGGHGALILGHNHPAVVEAVCAQVPKGAHYGASHPLEVEWAALIHEMVPSAEKVRFTISGTEATLLALRLARAHTRKNKIIRFAGHFHGWHDHVCFPAGGAPGIIPGIVEDVLIVNPNDVARVEDLLATRGDVAAVILEPTGATFGTIPTDGETLRALREATRKHDVVLIFDEVIAGFRCSTGGAQKFFGVTPDITTLAKILAGGYPGAALAGRADIFSLLDYRHKGDQITPPRVIHQGTYNAGPVSAAAGIATLKQIRDTNAIERANQTAAAIRDGLNTIIRRRGLPWLVYGKFSDFHLHTAPEIPTSKGGVPNELVHKLRTGMLLHGVDIVGWPGGVVSAVHGEADVERTVAAFDATLGMLAAEGSL